MFSTRMPGAIRAAQIKEFGFQKRRAIEIKLVLLGQIGHQKPDLRREIKRQNRGAVARANPRTQLPGEPTTQQRASGSRPRG